MGLKVINRCILCVESYPSTPAVSMALYCDDVADFAACSHYVSRTKARGGTCKFYQRWRYCTSPAARKEAANRVIAALKKRVLDKE